MRLTPTQRRALLVGLTAYIVLVIVLVFALQAKAAPDGPPPSPGPGWVLQDGGWLPPGHPAIRTAPITITPNPDAPPLITTLQACVAAQPDGASNLELLKACGQFLGVRPDGCENINPYTEPERAIDCTERAKALNPPTPIIKAFTLGAVYGRPYGERQILIIGKALGLDGVEVVTAQVVRPASERGTAIAFLNNGGTDAGQWWPVGGGR